MDRYCLVLSTGAELGTSVNDFLSGALHSAIWSHKPAGGRLFVACRDCESSRVKWREIERDAAVSVADTVLECCIAGHSGQYEMADILHSLCDQLPRFGYFLDVFWLFYGVIDSVSLPLEICSALLRVSEWHRGKVTLLPADEAVLSSVPAELQNELGNLVAVRSSFDDATSQRVCWRGNLVIGSAVLEECSLRCLQDACDAQHSGGCPDLAFLTDPDSVTVVEESMAASNLVFNSILGLDDLPITLMCHQTYVLELPQNAGTALPSWKALLDYVTKEESGILLKMDWLQPLPAHVRHGKWSIDDTGARDASKLCCSQLTTESWEAYITEEEHAQCISESCCSRSISHGFLLLTPTDRSDGIDGINTIFATCLRQPDVANGTLPPHRRSCCCRCRCAGRGLVLPLNDPARLLDAFVPPGSPSTWLLPRRSADGACFEAVAALATTTADVEWDTSSWPERLALQRRAVQQGGLQRRRSWSPSLPGSNDQQQGSGICLTLNEMVRRLSASLRERPSTSVSDGSSADVPRLPVDSTGCCSTAPIVPPADAVQPWPACRMARDPGVHYCRGECSEEEGARLWRHCAGLLSNRETSSSFNPESRQGLPIFVSQAASGTASLQSCPPLKSRKLSKSSKCSTGPGKAASDRMQRSRALARALDHHSSLAPSRPSLLCGPATSGKPAKVAARQPSTSQPVGTEALETSAGPIKRPQQHVEHSRSQSTASLSAVDHRSDDGLSGRLPRESDCCNASSATSASIKARQRPLGDEPRGKESRSERHKRRLLDIVTKVLKGKGVTPDSNAAFAACQQRLFNTVKGFVKDLPNSHSLGDNMRRLAEKFCSEVIEFETSVLLRKRNATRAHATSDTDCTLNSACQTLH